MTVFEQERNYPTAIAVLGDRFLDDDDQDAAAIDWLLEQEGGEVVVVTPTKRTQMHGVLEDFIRRYRPEHLTQRGVYAAQLWRRRVLLVWPDDKTVGEVWRPGLDALAVIEGSHDLSAWSRAAKASVLGSERQSEDEIIGDPIVRAAFSRSLGVNQNHVVLDWSERDTVVNAIRVVLDHGHRIDPDLLYSFLLANGWNGKLADQVRKLVAEANVGKRHQIRNKARERDYYDVLVERVNKGEL